MTHITALLVHSSHVVELFARGGGGGSGGHGGGGGGGFGGHGGSGGGGGGFGAVVGYFASYYSANWAFRRDRTALGFYCGVLAGILAIVLIGTLSAAEAFLTFFGAAFGLYGSFKNWHGGFSGFVRKNNNVALQVAAQHDAAWDETALTDRFTQVFASFQADWTNANLQHMQTYMTPEYFAHNAYMLKALEQMHRQNVVGDPKLLQTFVYQMHDDADDNADYVVAYIQAVANDQLIDKTDDKVIYTDNSMFQEFWRFNRVGDTWMFAGIRQMTENALTYDASLEAFAQANHMFYSPDWGWLLLPQRGQLFGKANFKNSDVNNHVIGEWQGLLVQLYTYIPAKASSSATNYLIGQINLPKSYGGIIIKRRDWKSAFSLKPRGYNSMSFEWPNFNQRYQVFATDVDQVTSFELLNPAFMAELYDMNLPISIEVVDNTVYFYCKASTPERSYEDMLKVLLRAWRELKM